MIFLRENEDFGVLSIEEVFLSYDGPRLFVAISTTGQRYLVNCLDSEDSGETWLLTAVSDRRISALKDGDLQLRDAFTAPESHHVTEISTSLKGELLKSKRLGPRDLTDDLLPIAGVALPPSEIELTPVSAPLLARALNSNVVLLRIFPHSRKHEAPAHSMGEILSTFSSYLQIKLKEAYEKAEVGLSNSIPVLLPEVNVVGTFAGSLGVEFSIRGDKEISREALQTAVRNLALSGDKNTLKEQMRKLDPNEAQTMKRFLLKLTEAKSDLSVETASTDDEVGTKADASLKIVKRAVRGLRTGSDEKTTDLKTLEAELIGVNLRAKTFEIRVLDDDSQIKGTMNAEIFNDISKAELPSRYRVVLEGRSRGGVKNRTSGSDKITMVSATKLH